MNNNVKEYKPIRKIDLNNENSILTINNGKTNSPDNIREIKFYFFLIFPRGYKHGPTVNAKAGIQVATEVVQKKVPQ
jgi:hypothetical protein